MQLLWAVHLDRKGYDRRVSYQVEAAERGDMLSIFSATTRLRSLWRSECVRLELTHMRRP
jgi:hypothetical protein